MFECQASNMTAIRPMKNLLHLRKLLSFPIQVNRLSAFILTTYKNKYN